MSLMGVPLYFSEYVVSPLSGWKSDNMFLLGGKLLVKSPFSKSIDFLTGVHQGVISACLQKCVTSVIELK